MHFPKVFTHLNNRNEKVTVTRIEVVTKVFILLLNITFCLTLSEFWNCNFLFCFVFSCICIMDYLVISLTCGEFYPQLLYYQAPGYQSFYFIAKLY